MLSRRRLLAGTAASLAAGALPARAATVKVVVNKMRFEPAEAHAKVGDTIEWVNEDMFAHTATVKGDWEVMLPVKKSGALTLEAAGTIDYYCRFHPNMRGRLVVTAG